MLAAALPLTSMHIKLPSETASAAAGTRVSVHDPSIIKADGTYYVFGSHIEAAKSTNLRDRKRFTNGYARTNNAEFGALSSNLKKHLHGQVKIWRTVQAVFRFGHQMLSGIPITSLRMAQRVHI